MTSSKPQFQWDDPFFMETQLSDEERMIRDAAKAFADDVLMPRVISDYRDESFDPAILKQMGAVGLLGPTIPEKFGGAGVNHVATGLLRVKLNEWIPATGQPCLFNHRSSCIRSFHLAATSKSKSFYPN